MVSRTFSNDQGVQFTSAAFVEELETRDVRISMDGKGRFLDNIFIERLWRSLKYEEVFIKAYEFRGRSAPRHRRVAVLLQRRTATPGAGLPDARRDV